MAYHQHHLNGSITPIGSSLLYDTSCERQRPSAEDSVEESVPQYAEPPEYEWKEEEEEEGEKGEGEEEADKAEAAQGEVEDANAEQAEDNQEPLLERPAEPSVDRENRMEQQQKQGDGNAEVNEEQLVRRPRRARK